MHSLPEPGTEHSVLRHINTFGISSLFQWNSLGIWSLNFQSGPWHLKLSKQYINQTLWSYPLFTPIHLTPAMTMAKTMVFSIECSILPSDLVNRKNVQWNPCKKICSMECCKVLYAHIGVWHTFLGWSVELTWTYLMGRCFFKDCFWHPFELDLTKVHKFADLDQ